MTNAIIEAIYSRRVTRFFTDCPIAREDLETIVQAGRWSPAGGNRRLQRFLVITRKKHIEILRLMAPGIDGMPTAIIAVCTNHAERERQGYRSDMGKLFLDVGMAGENILLAAHSLGIGAGPVTSFSKAAVRVIGNLPGWISPELLICLGYRSDQQIGGNVKPAKALRWKDITYWEQYDSDEPSPNP